MRAVTAALLAAGTLAAGCGTTHAGAPSGGVTPTASGDVRACRAFRVLASARPRPCRSGPARSSGSAAPVPTVSGGRSTPGEPACAGLAGERADGEPAGLLRPGEPWSGA